ncbi:hypothetical protein GCM10020369_49740 [Cryptosporangium minutisporangium]|uniref:Uncharacterized protein n=1 Tax=Cryptosporangium minutisporangium TaxID=113569 RepID=A0ABP6T4S3_9ACTN
MVVAVVAGVEGADRVARQQVVDDGFRRLAELTRHAAPLYAAARRSALERTQQRVRHNGERPLPTDPQLGRSAGGRNADPAPVLENEPFEVNVQSVG